MVRKAINWQFPLWWTSRALTFGSFGVNAQLFDIVLALGCVGFPLNARIFNCIVLESSLIVLPFRFYPPSLPTTARGIGRTSYFSSPFAGSAAISALISASSCTRYTPMP